MTDGRITLSIDGPMGTILVDRPAKLNALDAAMVADLAAHCRTAAADRAVRAVVVTGAGSRAFCAGGDIAAWSALDPLDFARFWVRDGHDAFDALARPPGDGAQQDADQRRRGRGACPLDGSPRRSPRRGLRRAWARHRGFSSQAAAGLGKPVTEPSSLEALLEQERRLAFVKLDNDTAIALGLHLLERARRDGLALTIDVTRFGQQLFHAALPGTSLDNDRWVERKRAVVERFGHSSLYMRRLCDEAGTSLAARFQLDPLAFAAYGGAFPLIVRDVGVVGTVTVSGLPHEADHAFVVEALDTFLPPPDEAGTPKSFYLAVGDEVVLEREITEADVDGFAELSGDRSPNHVDEEAMAVTAYGGRIAHGALLVAYLSACSTAIVERVPDARLTETPVSLGYDRIRFIKPVRIGERLTLRYTIRETDPIRRRSRARFAITGTDGTLLCVGDHILQWVPARNRS